LADSGALASLSGNRRAAYWQALGRDKTHTSLPLLEAAGADIDEPIPESLQPMNQMEEGSSPIKEQRHENHRLRLILRRYKVLKLFPSGFSLFLSDIAILLFHILQ